MLVRREQVPERGFEVDNTLNRRTTTEIASFHIL